MYHLRYQSTPWATHHIVSRCFQGFSFLTPEPHIVEICTGVLGYALERHQGRIKLHHYAFLSNHFHLLLSSRETKDLASFMSLLKSKLTRELNRVHRRSGTLWGSRYASEEVLDEESVVGLMKYITQNSVKEGLVDHPSEWGGLHGCHQLLERRVVQGPFVHRTRLHQEPELTEAEVTTYYEVRLEPPPMWEREGLEAYYKRAVTLCEAAIVEARELRNREAMGMELVLQQEVFQQRRAPRGTRPLCRTKCRELLKVFRERYYRFKAEFQEVSRVVRRSIDLGLPLPALCFPEGGVPLFGRYVAPS